MGEGRFEGGVDSWGNVRTPEEAKKNMDKNRKDADELYEKRMAVKREEARAEKTRTDLAQGTAEKV